MNITKGSSKTVVEVDADFLSSIDSKLDDIRKGLQNISAIPTDEFLTADEFMTKCKISRWKFNAMISEGLLEYKKLSRKFYIPISQIARYFSGEFELKKK